MKDSEEKPVAPLEDTQLEIANYINNEWFSVSGDSIANTITIAQLIATNAQTEAIRQQTEAIEEQTEVFNDIERQLAEIDNSVATVVRVLDGQDIKGDA